MTSEILIKFINEKMEHKGFKIKRSQTIEFYVNNEIVLNSILNKFKFKDIGTIHDYKKKLPQPESIGIGQLLGDHKLQHRMAVSKKYNSVVYYCALMYSIRTIFVIDLKYLNKFMKYSKSIIRKDTAVNLFRNADFKCNNKEYIEIAYCDDNTKNNIAVMKKEISDENLIFDQGSAIYEVMNDIRSFFKDETYNLYRKLDLTHKRGIILYGNPGNGKSAAIREIIRTTSNVTKIIINPNVSNVTKVLQSLTSSLDGKKSIIIMEDIDSLITEENRSEFLNILDGVDIRSGIYFIGTTNYPDRIDPAFMNRSGRFDRTYKIDSPSEETRRMFFESRNVDGLFAEYNMSRIESKYIDIFDKRYKVDKKDWFQREFKEGHAYLLSRMNDFVYPYRGKIENSNYANIPGIYDTDDSILLVRPKGEKEKKIYSKHRIKSISEMPYTVTDLFVKYSKDLAMADLKELITSASYILALNTDMTVDDAIKLSYDNIASSRDDHLKNHKKSKSRRSRLYDDDDWC